MPKKRDYGELSPSELESLGLLNDAGVLSPSEVKGRGYKYYPDNDSYGVPSPSEIKTKESRDDA